jgi:hypothetical protein
MALIKACCTDVAAALFAPLAAILLVGDQAGQRLLSGAFAE